MLRVVAFSVVLCIAASSIGVAFGQTITPAPACEPDKCVLPDCLCSSSEIPGNLSPQQTPQIVFVTFDDAVNFVNFDFYEDVFSTRTNPNGQRVTITFFISHDYTNYSMVHELWREGHEIALHTISHREPATYWASINETTWNLEVADQRDQMAYFANIPKEEIVGMRAPFLQIGGDAMYSSLHSGGFAWESSRPSLEYYDSGLWPYTNDYASTQDCEILPCPVGSYPGFWTVPMVDFKGDNGMGCSMIDSCLPVPETQADTYNLLYRNFQNSYNGQRAPFGLYVHSAWINGTGIGDEIWQRRLGYIQFLDYLGTLNDVYIVAVNRGIEWIKNPTSLDKVADFPAFQTETKPSQCTYTSNCLYKPDPNLGEKYLRSCALTCPKNYPWVGDPLGNL